MAAKSDLYQDVTDQIIKSMEAGTVPWSPNWTGGARLDMPLRSNGELYRGINVLMLWASATSRGFSGNQWFTYKQAQALGGQVIKGQRGSLVVKYGTFEREDDTKGMYLRRYAVFNASQIEGLPSKYSPKSVDEIDTGARAIPVIEQFYNSIGADVRADGTQPRYMPSSDVICIPMVQQFTTAHEYYGTLAHELIHWTGHKRRLDRFPREHSRENYAFEELVAELGACFLTSQIGGERNTDNSAAYIESWLKALRDDKKYIFKAAAKAQAAVDFLLETVMKSAEKVAA